MKTWRVRLYALLLLSAAGCAIPRPGPPPDMERLTSADADPFPLPSELPGFLTQLIKEPETRAAGDQLSVGPVRNVLVLSGGGKLGAFSAGILHGWSTAGNRPCFDVVTGTSTGALIAPFAFLGARYDSIVTDCYTKVRTRDIYQRRPLPALLWGDSLASSAPLRRRIEELISYGLLEEIAQAHAAGRRLYVGTTNLDTGRRVIWDMGAIAAGTDTDKLALFRKILLASCSIPALLPPVPIEIEVNRRRYTELHADGGVRAQMFLPPNLFLGENGGTGTNVYVLVAGKLSPQPRRVERQLVKLSREALQELLDAKMHDDLLRVFLLTKLTGGRFAVASIPAGFPVHSDPTRFEPKEMRQLFDAGSRLAASGAAWRSAPPTVNPQEWPWPRSGNHFFTRSE